MKLVREHINEKFTEDSDPIHDIGIGIESAIDYSFKKFVELSKEYGQKITYLSSNNTYSPINSCTRSYPGHISFSNIKSKSTLCVNLYSDTYYYKNKKVVNKKQLINKLVKESGLNIFLIIIPSNDTVNTISEVYYKIKPEYIEFFSEEKIKEVKEKLNYNEVS